MEMPFKVRMEREGTRTRKGARVKLDSPVSCRAASGSRRSGLSRRTANARASVKVPHGAPISREKHVESIEISTCFFIQKMTHYLRPTPIYFLEPIFISLGISRMRRLCVSYYSTRIIILVTYSSSFFVAVSATIYSSYAGPAGEYPIVFICESIR